MPAALLYVAARGTVADSAFLTAAQAAASPVGLTIGPWTSAQVTVPTEAAPSYGFPASVTPTPAQMDAAAAVGRDPLTAAQRAAAAAAAGMQPNGWALWGTSGPFAGVLIDALDATGTARPPVPPSVLVSAFKAVIINPSGAVTSAWRGNIAHAVGRAVGHPFTASSAPWGSTPPGDRGVPANPVYTEYGAGGGSGFLFGLVGVAALAWFASRGTATGMRPTFQGTPDEHEAQARWLLQQSRHADSDLEARFTIARALQEATWMKEGPAKRELWAQMKREAKTRGAAR
jgi:hypothetical protein